MGGWQGSGWGMIGAWFFLAVLVVGMVLLVVALVRGWHGGGASSRPTGRSRARQVLDERFARGEIDTSKYQNRLQQLGERE